MNSIWILKTFACSQIIWQVFRRLDCKSLKRLSLWFKLKNQIIESRYLLVVFFFLPSESSTSINILRVNERVKDTNFYTRIHHYSCMSYIYSHKIKIKIKINKPTRANCANFHINNIAADMILHPICTYPEMHIQLTIFPKWFAIKISRFIERNINKMIWWRVITKLM